MVTLKKETQVRYLYQDKFSSYAMPQLMEHTFNESFNKPTVLQYYDYFIQQETKLINNGKSKGTIQSYEKRFRNILKFLQEKNQINIFPWQVSVRLIREFEYWMRSDRKCSNDYTMKNIQLLGRIMKLAIENKDAFVNPLDLYDFKYERNVRRVFLEPEELAILENRVFKQKTLNKIKDVYIFCCYTGLSYSDVHKFDVEIHIINGPDRTPWINYNREKTDSETYLPLLSTAEALLNKYNGKLPVMTNQVMNRYLKEIAVLCNIDKNLTMHTARKTFGNIMHNEFSVPIDSVSRMLGHTSVRTTQQWYVKTSMKKVMKDMENVKFFFTEPTDEFREAA